MVIYHGTIHKKILQTNPRWIWSLSHYTSNSFSIKPPGLPPWLGDFFSGQIMPGQTPTSGITTVLLRKDQLASMDGVFTYIYHQKLRLNVGKYTILDEQLLKTSWKFSRETKCDMICKFFFTCYTFGAGFLFQSINSLIQNCLGKPKMKLLGLYLRPSFMWSVIYSLRNRLYPYCFNNGEPWDLGTKQPQRRCESSESSCKRNWPTCHLVFQSPSFLVANCSV